MPYPRVYQITNYEYFLNRLAEVADDDLTLPWNTYPCLDWERGASGAVGYRYGVFRLPDKSLGYPKLKAHRTAFEKVKGPIPTGMDICHHCDRPICFRPVHLFAGAAKDNIQDMVRKGRSYDRNGSKNPAAKLCEADVIEIRRLRANGLKYSEIAELFGVTKSVPFHIVTRRSWDSLK